jgi:hypothetical protein
VGWWQEELKMVTWVPIPGFPGYECSDDGRFRSLPRVQKRGTKSYTIVGGILKPKMKDGYLFVYLGRRKQVACHRTICWAFNGPPPPDKEWTLHRDGNKINNVPDNLYWGTPKDNGEDRVRHGMSQLPYKLKEGDHEEIVRQFKNKEKTAVELGLEYGISANYVQKLSAKV